MQFVLKSVEFLLKVKMQSTEISIHFMFSLLLFLCYRDKDLEQLLVPTRHLEDKVNKKNFHYKIYVKEIDFYLHQL